MKAVDESTNDKHISPLLWAREFASLVCQYAIFYFLLLNNGEGECARGHNFFRGLKSFFQYGFNISWNNVNPVWIWKVVIST